VRTRRLRFPTARAVALLLLVGAALVPGRGRAQGLHPLPRQTRPLHERLAAAEVVVVGRIEAVDTGRITVAAERVLLGEPPQRFEVKRSPSAPPPLGPGDRAILLLQGARSPYLLVDEPRETIRLADEASAARWGQAVAQLVERRAEPDALVGLYVEWLDQGPATLRDLGVRGLTDPRAPFQPLPDAVLLERAQAAADATRPDEVRLSAALLAARSPAATDRLLEATPAGDGAADLAIAMTALQGGALHRSPKLEAAMQRALRHPSPELRRGALRVASAVPPEVAPGLDQQVADLLERESDAEVRRQAQQTLAAMQKRRARRTEH
jgi:hypothetical protein